MTARTWPAGPIGAGSTSTARTIPPSPATPTGMSTRAARDPVAAIVRATWIRPGTTTVTVGTCPPP